MKKILCVGMLGLILTFGLGAQESDSTVKYSDAYTKIFLVAKIWSHRLGYRIDYFTPKMEIKEIYLPIELFSGKNSKARLVYGTGPSYPYMAVTWVNGQIDHITIYGFESPGALSWGVLDSKTDYSSQFAQELKISF